MIRARMFAPGRIATTQSAASSPLHHVAADNNDSERRRLRQQRKRHNRSIAKTGRIVYSHWEGLVRVDQTKIIADRKASDDEAAVVNQMLIESTRINQMLIDEDAAVNQMLTKSTRAYLAGILRCDSGHVHFDHRYTCGNCRRFALPFM